MPVDLGELLAGQAIKTGRPLDDKPVRCAVLTMEIQRGVVGDLSTFPELAAAARETGIGPNTGRLCVAARTAGVPVIHCTAEFRADRAGTIANSPLHSVALSRPEHLLIGTAATELVPELGAQADDFICPRLHGVSPFTGTTLDSLLDNLGVRVVIATGVSVNVGIFGLCVEAVNLGYQVVVPRDAVCGVPADYAESVLRQSIALLATITTVDEVIGALDSLSKA